MIKQYFLWLLKFLTILIVFLFAIPVCLIAIGASISAVSGAPEISGNKIAVVELNGVIMDSRETIEELHKQVSSSRVDGVVLRIDSPGGAVGPSEEIYRAVNKLKNKKPIVVSMGSIAASGGLYSALGASKIFAQQGTLTGSIGVIMEVPNLKGISDKVGFTVNTIKSGQLKDAGNMYRDMTEEERKYLETLASETHQDFIAAVVSGRGIDPNKVAAFADGRVILGKDAVMLGLVDKIGDVYDAAKEVYVILGKPLPEGKEATLYYPQDKFKEFKNILNGISSIVSAVPVSPQLKSQWQ